MSNTDVKKDILMSCANSFFILYKMEILEWVKIADNLVGYASILESNGCEVQIVGKPRNAEQLPSDRIFSLHRETIVDSFSCIVYIPSKITFKLKSCIILSTFLIKCSARVLSTTLTLKRLAENDVKY